MLSGFDKEIGNTPSASDGKVKVDGADAGGFLKDKLVQGSNVTLAVGQNSITVNGQPGRLVVTRVTSAVVNTQSGYHYVCDGVGQINLPSGTEGASIGISDIGNTFTANPVTVTADGSDYVGRPNQSSLVLDRNMACIVLGFTNGVWVYLSAESFNDLGSSTAEGGLIGIGVEDGDKGDIVVSNSGTVWNLDTSGVVAGSYEKPTLTIDDKGRVTGATEKQITLSSDVTWYVATDGDPNADGLTVSTPIDPETAFKKIPSVVFNSFTLTLKLAAGTYNSNYDEYYNYGLRIPEGGGVVLSGETWTTDPTTIIRSLELSNSSGFFLTVENVKFTDGILTFNSTSELLIKNCCYEPDQTTWSWMFLSDECRVRLRDTIQFNTDFYSIAQLNRGAKLDLESCVLKDAGTPKTFDTFIDLKTDSVTYIGTPTIDGTFTGKKFNINKGGGYISGNVSLLPGDTPGTYEKSIFYDDVTLATVTTSGSYNDLSNLPTLGTASAVNIEDITGTTIITVTVDTGKFLFNGLELTNGLLLLPGRTYRFDLSDATNATHDLRFSITSDGTHGGGVEYTTGVTATGTSGTDGIVTFIPPVDAPETLYPYCITHASMGGTTVFKTKGGGGHTIQDEGTPLAQRTNLNFVGSAVTVTDDAGNDKTIVTVSSVDGQGWTGGSYDAGTGIVTFTSNDGLGFSTGDLRGATGATGATGSVSAATSLILDHTTTPSDPGAGKTAIYAKSDGLIYKLAAGGSEENVGGASAFADLSDVDTTGLQTGQVMVWNGTVWVPGSTSREVLTANRTYYVRTDGSDSNDGLTDSAGGAFLTIQKAVDAVAALDASIYNVSIQVGSGTYSESVELKKYIGSGTITIEGDTTTPANCVLDIPVDSDGFWCNSSVGAYTIQGFKITSTGSSTGMIRCIYVAGGTTKIEYGAIEFATLNTTGVKNHVWVQENAIVRPISSYTISASCDYHWLANPAGYINALLLPSPITITITGTPAIGTFVIAQKTGVVDLISTEITFSGGSTGTKYSVTLNGIINTNGGGVSYFPGSVAGTTATGGQYA